MTGRGGERPYDRGERSEGLPSRRSESVIFVLSVNLRIKSKCSL